MPAKADYSKFDSARAKKYFAAPDVKTPSFFPILSLLPQRCLIYVKASYPDLLVPTFFDYFVEMWENGIDLSKPELLSKVLGKRFKEGEVRQILEAANSPEWKQNLNANTEEALKHGAFGCPWYWVRNSKGEEEPFFGSDRYVTIVDSSALSQHERSHVEVVQGGASLTTRNQTRAYPNHFEATMSREWISDRTNRCG